MLSKSDKEAIEINTLSKTSILSVFLKINPVFDEAKRVFEWFYSKGILPVVDNDAYIKIKGFSSNYFLESNERRNLLISFLQKADMSICDVVFEKIEPVISEQLSESFKNYKVDIETKDMISKLSKIPSNIRINVLHSYYHSDTIKYGKIPGFELESLGTKRLFELAAPLFMSIG
ncbi:MAG: hypothetical protein P9L91_06285, partial [Candidatus Zophobacter franzmannii]|nr:hypothetical protein [Candidatus Zophobacter franzmannii]